MLLTLSQVGACSCGNCQFGEERSTCAPAEIAVNPFLQLLQCHIPLLILAALDVGINGNHEPGSAESALAGMMPCKLLCASREIHSAEAQRSHLNEVQIR